MLTIPISIGYTAVYGILGNKICMYVFIFTSCNLEISTYHCVLIISLSFYVAHTCTQNYMHTDTNFTVLHDLVCYKILKYV
jgi:hypothetical protein